MSTATSLPIRSTMDSGPRYCSDAMRPPTNSQQQETHEHGKAHRLRGGGAAKVC